MEMEGNTSKGKKLPLSTHVLIRHAILNRVFALVYVCAITALLYHHALTLFHSPTLLSFSISIAMLISDILFAFMWSTTTSSRLYPIHRWEFPENRQGEDFPALDIFICTADPYKEPPMGVVNTALSVMAYDYPPEKLSVYISDDGGSKLTLFALIEAAKFGVHWLPFCRENNILERSPNEYFGANNPTSSSEADKIKMMYENMRMKVENVVDKGKIMEEYITGAGEEAEEAFAKWTTDFTRQNHPTVIQVLLEVGKNKDIRRQSMPNLIYVSREKRKISQHHFKAGALNTLLRVSSVMTNAPIILTLDCDMYSNDPQTPHRALCYLSDPSISPKLGYVQFPQHFHGLNKSDIYAVEYKRLFHIHTLGMDGLCGPNYLGTDCFFSRRIFFGGPTSLQLPEIQELGPNHVVEKPIKAQSILELAHNVAACNYEDQTHWGSKLGFRYGSLVEDYYTGYRLQCEGWKSVFCNPKRAAFLGDAPITLTEVLSQNKRWAVGLLEVAFSKYCPLTFGAKSMGILMGLAYAQSAFWPIWSIPITIYAFIPQLALLNKLPIFPQVSDPWFLLYCFLFLGAYGQDCIEFVLAKGSVQRWWSDQRMWLIRGLSSYLFGSLEYAAKHLGISTQGFNLTSKLLDDEQSKRYDKALFEFGVHSPMFVPLATAAIINLFACFGGFFEVLRGGKWEEFFVQMFLAGFGVLNCWPIYEAMFFRADKGKMPIKTTLISSFLASAIYTVASLVLRT